VNSFTIRVAPDYRILGSSKFVHGLLSVGRLFCQLAVGKMGCPGTEVARFLGITTSAVVRAAKTEEVKEVQKYL
jgi:hypothetical protein